jgi:hypothetical protein
MFIKSIVTRVLERVRQRILYVRKIDSESYIEEPGFVKFELNMTQLWSIQNRL